MTLEPLETVQCYYKSLTLGHRQVLMELLDPRVVIDLQEGFPGAQRRYDGLRAYFEEFLYSVYGAFELEFTPEVFLACGTDVAVLGRHQGRAIRTGIPVDVAFVHLWTVREGRMVHGRLFTDTAVLRDAVSGPPATIPSKP